MKTLKKKLGKNGGFTLVEMLIVVAIIAILIAVSIPLVTTALEKANNATDQANERSAKAEASILVLSGDSTDAVANALKIGTKVYYNNITGKLQENTTGITGYGKCSSSSCATTDFISGTNNHANQIITVTYTAGTDTFAIAWE